MKVERNRAWNKYTLTPEDEKDEKFLDRIAQLEEENKKLKEENEIIMRNADGIAHHNVELMKKVKELEKKLWIE